MKKIFTYRLLISVMIFVLLFSGCQTAKTTGDKEDSTPITSGDETEKATEPELEPVTLIWHSAVARVYPDIDMVWTEINKYLKEKLNLTLDYHFYIPADFREKASTMISAGQYVDMLFSGRTYSFGVNAQRNAYLPLEDYIEEYLPKTYKNVPKGAWDAVSVDGHIYGIPPYKDFADRLGFVYNKTMADKYNLEVPESGGWSVMQDLLPIFYAAKEARDADEPDLANMAITGLEIRTKCYYPHEVLTQPACVNVPGIEAFKGQGSGETVFNIFETDEYEECCKLIKKLVDDGIYPYDGSNFDKDSILSKGGKLLGFLGEGYIELDPNVYEGRITKVSTSKLAIMTTSYIQAGFQTISSKCKYPERALMFHELINNDPVLANMSRFGLEGEHYNYNAEGRLDPKLGSRNAGAKTDSDWGYYLWYGYQMGNILAGDIPVDNSTDFADLLKNLNDTAIQNTNLGFAVDTNPIQNEIAACENVRKEYDTNTNLKSGMIEDLDTAIAEFRAKLRANGSQKIVDEVQNQLTAWRKSVGKTTK